MERKFQRATVYKVPSRTVDYKNKSFSVETFVHPDNNKEQLGHITETNMSYTLLNDSLRNLINKNDVFYIFIFISILNHPSGFFPEFDTTTC